MGVAFIIYSILATTKDSLDRSGVVLGVSCDCLYFRSATLANNSKNSTNSICEYLVGPSPFSSGIVILLSA